MRFDDSLRTVLSAETTSEAGVQAAWRQLVDLLGRRRAAADEAAIGRLRELRPSVPTAVRAASARALAFAQPPQPLVALFGEDRLEIAAPVLRTANLSGADWTATLASLSPEGRSVLRHRRDLPEDAVRGLEAFGSTDFVLGHDAPAVGEVAEPVAAPLVEPAPPTPAGSETPRFEIADLVARIDAFNRTRERPTRDDPSPAPAAPAEAFRFETDAHGTIAWVDGVTRTALVGMSLAHLSAQDGGQVDGGVAGAYRRRSAFRNARLLVAGSSDAAGSWRLSGVPAFEPASGRFVGYRGSARRPRADESATPVRRRETSESLRQLVHELRTPTNAIIGFAELIETQMLGPVADPYRRHAAAVRSHAGALVQAIDDLDTAARIEGDALELRPARVALQPLVAAALAGLAPLRELRGADVHLLPDEGAVDVVADPLAVERLVGRLLAALVSAAGTGERLTIAIAEVGDSIALVVDKPVALDAADEDAEVEGAPLLGTAFALRLAGNLASELGGALVIDPQRLTLRLPTAVDRAMGQASTN